MLLTKLRLGSTTAWIAALAAALPLSAAAPAHGATDVYPPGGGAFATGAEGWHEAEASCNISPLSSCAAGGEHDPAAGNPAGSLTARTSVELELLGAFESTVVLESPQFTVGRDGAATLHLDRQLAPGALVELAPRASYAVKLIDATASGESVLLEETVEGASGFAGRDAAATVAAGHSYSIAIEVRTSSSAAVNLLVDGETDVRFDNVALMVQNLDGGDGGAAGDPGADGADAAATGAATPLSPRRLRILVRRASPLGARLRGRFVFVRVRCPRRARRSCRIVLHGRIKRRIRVTQRRAVRVGRGKVRVVGLRVRGRFRNRLGKRRRILIVQRVRVGKVRTTFARSRALIRRR